MVSHEHCRGGILVQGDDAEAAHKVLPTTHVESGGGLVEQQQLRVGHQRTRDLDSLALPLGQRAEGAPCQVFDAELPQQSQCAFRVGRLVVLTPATGDGVRRGDHDVRDDLVRRNPFGKGHAGEPDSRPELEHIGTAEPFAQHLDSAAGGVLERGGKGEDRGLAGSVRAEDDPAFTFAHGPRDAVDDGHSPTHHVNVGEPQDVTHLPNTNEWSAMPKVSGCSCPDALVR